MADGHLFGVVACIKRLQATNSRLRMFGVLCGVVEPGPGPKETYNPRLCDMVLFVLKKLFPKFSAQTLRSRRVGMCFVSLAQALMAVEDAFPAEHCPFSLDRRQLTDGRRELLRRDVKELAMQYEKAFLRGRAKTQTASQATKAALTADEAKVADGPDTDDDLVAKGEMVEFSGDQLVVDVDELIEVCARMWYKQLSSDLDDLGNLYDTFDADKDGVLSYQEFAALIQVCTDHRLSTRETLEVFKVLSTMDGDTDSISRGAFAHVCASYGITPKRTDPSKAGRDRRGSVVDDETIEAARRAAAAAMEEGL